MGVPENKVKPNCSKRHARSICIIFSRHKIFWHVKIFTNSHDRMKVRITKRKSAFRTKMKKKRGDLAFCSHVLTVLQSGQLNLSLSCA